MKISLAITIFTLAVLTLSCKGRNNAEKNVTVAPVAPFNKIDEGDNVKFNYDKLSPGIIDYGEKSLKQMNFKFPDSASFTSKIKAVYSLDITMYKNDIIALQIADFTEIALKKDNYILIQDADADNDSFITPGILFAYNDCIFNNSRSSFNLLKTKGPDRLRSLVVQYGYSKDQDLLRFVFHDFDFDNATSFHDLIFQRSNNGKYLLREAILNEVETIVYGGKTDELMSAPKEGNGYNSSPEVLEKIMEQPNLYNNYERSIAVICEKSLEVGELGTVQKFLNAYPEMKGRLKEQHYFNCERLMAFTENLDVFNGAYKRGQKG